MSHDDTRLQALTSSVLTQIADRFSSDDGADLSLCSPLGDRTLFELYDDHHDGTWSIQVNGQTIPELERLPGIAGAKTRVAELIAKKIHASEQVLARSAAEGLMPA